MTPVRTAHLAVSERLDPLASLSAPSGQGQPDLRAAEQARQAVVARVLRAHPDPTTWPDSPCRAEARYVVQDVRQDHAHLMAKVQHWQTSGQATAQANLDEARRQLETAEAAQVTAQAAYQRQALLGPATTWAGRPLDAALLERLQDAGPVPARWSWARWRASAEHQAIWDLIERHERLRGPDSFGRDLAKLTRAWHDRNDAQRATRTQTQTAIQAQRQVDQGQQAVQQAHQMGALKDAQQQALSRILDKLTPAQQQAWLADLLPSALPAFLAAQAQVADAHRAAQQIVAPEANPPSSVLPSGIDRTRAPQRSRP